MLERLIALLITLLRGAGQTCAEAQGFVSEALNAAILGSVPRCTVDTTGLDPVVSLLGRDFVFASFDEANAFAGAFTLLRYGSAFDFTAYAKPLVGIELCVGRFFLAKGGSRLRAYREARRASRGVLYGAASCDLVDAATVPVDEILCAGSPVLR